MATDSSLLQSLLEAQGLYISGVYSLSRDKFTHILNSHNNNYEALLYRGYANLKLNALEESLKDAEAAVAVNSNRSEALLLKGIVLFHQGKHDAALNEVQRAKLILSSLDASDVRRLDVQKWEQTIEAEKSKRTTINTNNLIKKVEEQKTEKNDKTNGATFHPQSGKVTYKWRQTDNRVYIDIIFGLKKKEDLNVKIEARRVEISFPIQESKSFELNLDLFDEIDAEASLYNVHLDRIEIQLEKKNKGRNWTFLEKPDSQNEKVLETAMPKPVQQSQTTQQASYPSSAKVKRDWNKIDKEIDEDMKKNKDDYAEGDQLNAFFKQLYANSDENTRRAMMKSFQTSGGTVLSNNWDEVKDKDYEGKDRPSAPDGQEYRQWGK